MTLPVLGARLGMMARGSNAIQISILSSQNNVNLFTLAGSPVQAGTYVFTVAAGVTISATSTGTAALVTGSWPVGSVVTLINNGNIYGKEGAGGAGGVDNSNGSDGSTGGPAISLGYPLSIDNTNGNIFGGGGGGGGGGGSVYDPGGGGG